MMGSTIKSGTTILSMCCVAMSSGYLFYKFYKSQKRIKNPKCMPSNANHLPPDVLTEILSYLNVNDFLNCKKVMEQLNVLTEDHYFANKFMMHKKKSYTSNYCVTDDYLEKRDKLTRILATCNGLYLMIDSIKHYIQPGSVRVWKVSLCIRNYSTHQILKIPQLPIIPVKADYVFVCVPSTGEYKVVSIYVENAKRKCAVLTLDGDGNKWRCLDIPNTSQDSMVVQGGTIVHCVKGNSDDFEITSLDLETECFTVTNVGKNFIAGGKEDHKYWAINWNQCLSFVYIERYKLSVLVLEDHKKQKWAEKFVVSLSFMEEKKYVGKEIVPLFAQDGLLWISCSDDTRLGFDLKIGKITQTKAGKFGLRVGSQVFSHVPSIVTLKGMQPEGRKPISHPTRQ